jgi:hypothetical protein
MKRLWAVLAGSLLALGLGACAGQTDRLGAADGVVTEEALPEFSEEMVTSGPALTDEMGFSVCRH